MNNEKNYIKYKLTEGYHLIDAPTSFSNSGSARYEGVPNGWKADNRFMNLSTFADRERFIYMRDEAADTFYALNRDFKEETDGLLTAELLIGVKSTDSCAYVSLQDEAENDVVKLYIKSGVWTLSGVNENASDVHVSSDDYKFYSVIINLDLTNETASAVVNNRFIPEVAVKRSGVKRLKVGTEKGGTGEVKLEYVRMWKDHAVNEHFLVPDECAGEKPYGWDVEGDFVLAKIESCKGREVYSLKSKTKKGEVSSACTTFEKLDKKFSLEAYFLLPEKTDGAKIAFTNNGKDVFVFETKLGNLYYGDIMVNDYIGNIWQGLLVDADVNTGKAEIKVNGKKKADIDFDADGIDGVKITFSPDKDAVMWFDDVKAYPLVDHADYPAYPNVPDCDYNIGTNVCWLWRDCCCGEGWDSVSGFPEFEPYLGFYDEGSREYADWEIKQLIENGINFIHACWYSPNGAYTTPIKNQDYSFAALHDGYFNAKYSHLVKFCIMWENARMADVKGFEAWKNRVWNYWVEYYFKDDRYMRLDNKAVLTVFVPHNLEITFGSKEGVRAAIEFMNEDIKKYGYDGILVLSDNEFYKNYEYMNELGFHGSYAYQWGRDGYSGDYQIAQNRDFAKRSIEADNHHIPTVSVGFNAVGRGFIRSPFVSEEEHLKVCKDIKELLDDYHTGTWKDNTVIVSTWNEYSEGHLVAPTLSIGYSLLDNVRKTFTSAKEENYPYNVKPTEKQLERITRMYPPKHAPLRRLLIEESKNDIIRDASDLVAVKSFSMSKPDEASCWKVNVNVDDFKVENGVLSGVANRVDPSIIYNGFHPASEIDAIHVRMKCRSDVVSSIELYFTTDINTLFSADKRLHTPLVNSDGYVDYYIPTQCNSNWVGNVTGFRLDPIARTGEFAITDIEFMKYNSHSPTLSLGDEKLVVPFAIEEKDGDFEFAADKLLLQRLGLYYEWDRWTHGGTLLLKDRADNSYVYRAESDTVIVNGKDIKLGYTVKIRDGIPVFKVRSFLDILGRKYKIDGNKIIIEK